jgi:hypothetical protein
MIKNMKKHTEIQSKVLWLKNKFMKVFPIYIYIERERRDRRRRYMLSKRYNGKESKKVKNPRIVRFT